VSEVVVRLVGVGKSFPAKGGGGTVALEAIDLDISSGEFISLIGPSGCGKSTLLRVVGDLIEPSEGSVTVNGKPARRARQDRDYGIVFQAPVLFDWRSVEANVRLPLEVTGVTGPERDRRVREMLDLVELAGFAGHFPHQLSGGMQQRVAIARALAYNPSVLLMDEPFAALDALTRDDMQRLLSEVWRATRKTVVYVTHNVAEAVYLADRVVVMTPHPGTVKCEVAIRLPRPRDPLSIEFLDHQKELLHHLGT
jgi:NitT/TauT family transport system ATP-binding protein